MEYNFKEIEQKWRSHWEENQTNKTEENKDQPKYYGLTMFPYPSGAGLHVGHPLGYIASDIMARYKKHLGYNVLHPMGYDSFGLPAEQYAIQTGQHPAITTENNIKRYREQLDKIGFSFDWSREVRTSDPRYYKWTQWIFKQLFDAWYDQKENKARHIDELVAIFEKEGNTQVKAACSETDEFSSEDWNNFSEKEQQKMLMNYRLTYLADSWVNWCPALGTVLANDEVVNGVSERGGHPVEQKLMRQWSMRITAYAERLLKDLDTLDWSDAIKEQQKNWIGKSTGASVTFPLWRGTEGEDTSNNKTIEVFTTRPDTIFGVSFMVLAPEHELVNQITTSEYKEKVEAYQKQAAQKSERDRQSEVKNITGAFTGAYAIHPFTKEKVEIWIGDYVLASYGTGAVMAVPCGDQRDWEFARHFNIDIINVFEGKDISEAAYDEKDTIITNSDFLNGLPVKKAIAKAIEELEKIGVGKGKTNYRLRDAVFSRQRYWGEPFPVYYKDDVPYLIEDKDLPITLPEVDKYLPTEDGEPPLARATAENWEKANPGKIKGDRMEYNTMPGWAGSSWYFLRYMDPHNEKEFVSSEKADYWNQVDLYIGGSEHATGHLLYARFWTQFLYDRGFIGFNEPFKKMINQGMILGNSSIYYELINNNIVAYDPNDGEPDLLEDKEIPNLYISYDLLSVLKKANKLRGYTNDKEEKIFKKAEQIERLLTEKENEVRESLNKKFPNKRFNIDYSFKYLNESGFNYIGRRVNINYVENSILNIKEATRDKLYSEEFYNAVFIKNENNEFVCDNEIEKMSKSKFNVQTPDELVEQYGADTLRCYEMFLGPVEQSKPWDTQGINGVHNFLRKFWRLFHDGENNFKVSDESADKKALKSVHKTIKKVTSDIERFSLNTVVSGMMICVNELTEMKCNNREALEPLVILLHPFAPHITEELWEQLGHPAGSLSTAEYPDYQDKYLVDDEITYPVSFNGKMRFKLTLPAGLDKETIEKEALSQPEAEKWLDGKAPKKVIVVPGKIVNVVV